MRSNFRLPTAVALALCWTVPAVAAPKPRAAASDGSQKSGKEISSDDTLDKQMDWETKLLGPNTQKKIDLAKIQKLQAEELARREKQEKIDQVDRDRKEREAAATAAAQRNVKAPSTRDVPSVPEPPPAAKPAEKHDDAFVDKLLTGKSEKKKVSVSNDDVDQLLNQAKQEKPTASATKARGKNGDTVDQLLATTDRQASIKTVERKPAEMTETVSAEVAAREAAMKSIAAASASKSQDDRSRNKRPSIPDAAMLRAQATTRAPADPPAARPSAARAAWTDPFATESETEGLPKPRSQTGSAQEGNGSARPSQVPSSMATAGPTRSRLRHGAAGRHAPSARPAAGSAGSGRQDNWQDPFDGAGAGTKSRSKPVKATPAARPGKHPPNWKDPFA